MYISKTKIKALIFGAGFLLDFVFCLCTYNSIKTVKLFSLSVFKGKALSFMFPVFVVSLFVLGGAFAFYLLKLKEELEKGAVLLLPSPRKEILKARPSFLKDESKEENVGKFFSLMEETKRFSKNPMLSLKNRKSETKKLVELKSFCQKCGEEIPRGENSCPKCGFSLTKESGGN